jgi:hypothetical protein
LFGKGNAWKDYPGAARPLPPTGRDRPRLSPAFTHL